MTPLSSERTISTGASMPEQEQQQQTEHQKFQLRTKTAHRDGTCQYCNGTVHGLGGNPSSNNNTPTNNTSSDSSHDTISTRVVADELYPVVESLLRLSRAKQNLVCQPTSASSSETTTATTKTTIAKSATERIVWIHVECARIIFASLNMTKPEPPICRHWFRSRYQRCPFDDECFFLHPPPPTQTTTTINSSIDEPLTNRRTWGGRRRKLFKPTAAIFRTWVLQKFGHDYLTSSSLQPPESSSSSPSSSTRQQQQQQQQHYVLDIAGGNGRLAFEMENLSGVRTAVIDPRPLTLKKAYEKWNSGFYDRAASSPKLNRFLTHYDRSVEPNYPKHLRVFFDDEMTQRVQHYHKARQQQQTPKRFSKDDGTRIDEDGENSNPLDGISTVTITASEDIPDIQDTGDHSQPLLTDESWWNQSLKTARKSTWTEKGLEDSQVVPVSTDERDTNNKTNSTNNGDSSTWLSRIPSDVQDASEALSILANCPMVMAMHADQATEAAVDFALKMNKPFAVVPCCVFSSRFPRRTLRDGTTKVKTTSQLVQYLKEKDDRIQIETLPFEGMNQVVYMTPDQIQNRE